jgi:hypothetical protein
MEVTGLASVAQLFDHAVVEPWDDEPDDEPIAA